MTPDTSHPKKYSNITIIMGPTASGKSDLAYALAKKMNGVILNADSMQMYKGLKILTAKPDPCADIPHYLYDCFDNEKRYCVADWLDEVYKLIELLKTTPIMIVGGTGFYIKALIDGLCKIPPLQKKTQEIVDTMYRDNAQRFYDLLRNKDPIGLKRISTNDVKRAKRLMAIILQTGRCLHEFYDDLLYPPIVPGEIIYLSPPKDLLHKQIKKRIDAMFEQHVDQEVLEFHRHFPKPCALHEAIGFYEITCYLEQKASLEEVKIRMFQKTCQYAKRQCTFFSHQFKSREISYI